MINGCLSLNVWKQNIAHLNLSEKLQNSVFLFEETSTILIHHVKFSSPAFKQNAISFHLLLFDIQIQHLNDFNIGLINGWWSFDGLYSIKPSVSCVCVS